MKYILTFIFAATLFYLQIEKIRDIPAPDGYLREVVEKSSYQSYIRNFPIKKNDKTLSLYNGEDAQFQGGHFAILDIDVGNSDLQQCADAAIRLRAEYQFINKKFDEISFKFTNGEEAEFTKYAEGYRPRIKNNKVSWEKNSSENYSYETFRKYLNVVFSYAGSYSLSRDLKTIDSADIEIGDVLIQGGFPGHAIIAVDLAINPESGKKVILLAQSYMPAQEMHIIKNPTSQKLTPWYDVEDISNLKTPSWKFDNAKLKRF